MNCNEVSEPMFDGHTTYTCTRPHGHIGDHQTRVMEPRPGYVDWHDGGGHMWQWPDRRKNGRTLMECDHCGITFDPAASMKTKGGTSCFHCVFWAERLAQYINEDIFVIDGVCYSWGAEHGYGGRTFTVVYADGECATAKGLWNGGTVPPEYRDAMPDNARFEGAPWT